MATSSIVLWNARSLFGKLPDLRNYIANTQPLIIGICETWLQQKYTPIVPGYTILREDRPNRGGGGLAFLIRTTIPHSKIVLKKFASGVLEVLAIKIPFKNTWASILVAYNPSRNLRTGELTHYVSQLSSPSLILGDFNGHHTFWEPSLPSHLINTTGKTIFSFLTQSSTHSLITPPGLATHVQSYNGATSTLDLMFGEEPFGSYRISLGPYMASDHLPVVLHLEDTIPSRPQACRIKWKFTDDEDTWNKFAAQITTTYNPSTSLDEQINHLTETMITVGKAHFSLTKGVFGFRVQSIWWNDTCRSVIRDRNKAYNRWRKFPSVENGITHRRLSAICKRTIKKTKYEAWRKLRQQLSFSTPAKRAWNLVHKMSGKFVPQTFPLTTNGQLLLDDLSKSELLASHFHRVFTTPDPLRHRNDIVDAIISAKTEHSGMLSQPFTFCELEEVMKKLSPDKAEGPDFISNKMILHLNSSTKSTLLSIYNESWRTGLFPTSWKTSMILPFLKGNKDPSDPSSYRGIHLLSCPGKIFESMVCNRLYWFLETNSRLHPNQYGFRKQRSTIDCLLHMTHLISGAFQHKRYAMILFLDLKAAFDSASHLGILYKILKTGITGAPLSWLRDFLTSRSFQVLVGNTKSSLRNSNRGVPQGSVLSPLLFSVLLNDMPSPPSVDVLMYADDIACCAVAPTLTECQTSLQNAATEILSYLSEWGLSVNADKCALQCYTLKKIPFLPSISINSTLIPLRSSHTYLGLVLDAPTLTWKKHINYLAQDCLKRLALLKRLAGVKWGSSRENLLHLYQSYILSKIDYGSIVYGSAAPTNLKKLDVIHTTAMRIILGAFPSTPTQALYIETGLAPLKHRRSWLMAKKLILLASAPPDHPLYQIYSTYFETHRITSRKSKPPFVQQASSIFSSINTVTPPFISAPSVSPLPPSMDLLSHINCNLSHGWNKKDLPEEGRQLFAELLNTKYATYLSIYTDGSKIHNPASTSSALYIPTLQLAQSWKLSGAHSSVFAELFAIHKALLFCVQFLKPQKIVIFTDSCVALSLITTRYPKRYHRILSIIHKTLAKLTKSLGWTILYQWTPSHIGIQGNEIADKAAKLAHSHCNMEDFPFESEEYFTETKQLLDFHQNDELNTFLQTHSLGQIYSLDSPPLNTKCDRRTSTAIFRLKTGHCGLNSHLHRLRLSDTDICPSCKNSPETVTHYLFHCPAYCVQRASLRTDLGALGVSTFTVSTILGGQGIPSKQFPKIVTCLKRYLYSTSQINRI